MPRKSLSPVWSSFDKIQDDTVKCKICSATLCFSGGSTGSMMNHLKMKHPSAAGGKTAGSSQATLGSFLRRESCNPARSNKITELIAEMIASESLPISLVEADGFRKLLGYLEPGYTAPCRKTMTAQLNMMFENKKGSLKNKLKDVESVALTTDCWTSRSQEGYMTVTAHYIEDWQHHSAVLDTSPVAQLDTEDTDNGPQRHTAPALAQQLKNVAEHWQIDDKISAVVHDNASNTKDVGNLALDVPGLAVNAGLECNRSITKVIGGANPLVGHFKHSTVATKALEAKQQQMDSPKHRLISSCKTRWNSTFEMLERLIEARWPICSVLSDKKYTKLADAQTLDLKPDQWKLMEELVSCLKPLQVS